MKNRAPKIDPWGTPYFITPCQRKKNWAVLGDFSLTFC
jgi:hypothetical protein